ncbi:MAG: ribonuclease III [Spirulina sp.]
MPKDPRRAKQLQTLVQKLGLSANVPVDYDLLDVALTHSSYDRDRNYEQLEFIGDAVVRLAASEILLEKYPDAPVGEFTAVRSILVSDRLLAELAERYGIERYLLVSSGSAANKSGRQSRLADAFEALLGALYLSTRTMKLVRPWLDGMLEEKAIEVRQDPAFYNYKDALQEWTQGNYKILPEYRVRETDTGQNSQERFTAEVWLEDRCLGQGTGRSKKAAEQAAAKEAFLGVTSNE